MIPAAPIWWQYRAPACPRLSGGTLRADVAVIGGGFAGLSAAYHLLGRRPGARVVVLEATRIGAGASGRTTGILGPGVGQNLAALVRRHGPARAKTLYEESMRAVHEVGDLVARERLDCELRMTGQLIVARSDAEQARLAAQAALLQRLELPHERLDDAALEGAVRLVRRAGRREGGLAAIRIPGAGTLHPTRLLAGLTLRVMIRGGAVFEGARVVEVGGGRPVRLSLEGRGEVVADEVVVATAGYTPRLGLLRGRVLPLHLRVVATAPLDDEARQAVGWAGREPIIEARRIFSYFRLTADDRIVFGGGRPGYRWGGEVEDDPYVGRALNRLAAELLTTFPPEVRLRVARGWTGVIGYTLDTLPAIHRMRDRPAVVHAVGWSGHGVALALASGRWVAHILCDGAAPDDLPWYRERPPLLPLEPVRWLAVRGGARLMAALDQVS